MTGTSMIGFKTPNLNPSDTDLIAPMGQDEDTGKKKPSDLNLDKLLSKYTSKDNEPFDDI